MLSNKYAHFPYTNRSVNMHVLYGRCFIYMHDTNKSHKIFVNRNRRKQKRTTSFFISQPTSVHVRCFQINYARFHLSESFDENERSIYEYILSAPMSVHDNRVLFICVVSLNENVPIVS